MKLTNDSSKLLAKLASIADNYGGTGLWHDWMDADFTKAEVGNLSDLVQKKLVEVRDLAEGDCDSGNWYEITELGLEALAA